MQESVSESVLSAYLNSIKLYPYLNVCVNNPCDSKLLHMVMEGGKKILASRSNRMNQSLPTFEQIIAKYRDDNCKRDL